MERTLYAELPSIYFRHHEPEAGSKTGRYAIYRAVRVYRDASDKLCVEKGWATRDGQEWWFSRDLPGYGGKTVELPQERRAVNRSQLVTTNLRRESILIGGHTMVWRRYLGIRILHDGPRDWWGVMEASIPVTREADVYVDLSPLGL